MEEIQDRNGNEVASYDMTVNLKIDPARMRPEKQGILAVTIIKNREMRIATRLIGDIDIDALDGLQIKMPGISPIDIGAQKRKRVSAEATVPTSVSRISTTNVQTEKGKSPETIQPEETFEFGPENIAQEVTIQTEGEQEDTISRTPTPKTQSQIREEERSLRRQRHNKKRRYITSESSEEDTSEEEVREKKTRKTDSKKKPPQTKRKEKKTVAKDGRKLADLTNRERDDKGRLLGYKPGTEPAKIQRKKKKYSPEEPQWMSEQTPEAQTTKPRIKMPSILPKLATPQLKV